MGRRKGGSKNSETSIPKERERDEMAIEEEEEETEKGAKFFACYLLTSLSPRHKGHTYIGFTVNPRRRIKQHNGEMRSGAWRTKSKRPWEMVLCIFGFPTNVAALQFEWAWQHPIESLAVRKAAVNFKSLGGIANKVKMAFTMLTLPSWQSLNLTVNFFSTKYTKFSAGCPTLPEQMRVQVGCMDDLPCYTDTLFNLDENEDAWDEEEECETARNCTYIEEALTNTVVNNSLDCEETTIGEATEEHEGWIGEIGMKNDSLDFISSKNCQRRSNCTGNSQVQVSSSFVTRTSGASESSENRDAMCSLVEEHEGLIDEIDFEVQVCASESREDGNMFSSYEDRVALGLSSPTIAALEEDEPLSKSLRIPREVEIIDLLSPSPSYRINTQRKKRSRVSTVCPEIIDLTKSPIFV